MGQHLGGHTYRLHMDDDGKGEAHDIEFEALGSYAALSTVQMTCGSRPVTLFEDGHKLANIKYNKGFWEVSAG